MVEAPDFFIGYFRTCAVDFFTRSAARHGDVQTFLKSLSVGRYSPKAGIKFGGRF